MKTVSYSTGTPDPTPGNYKVGSLSYTKPALAVLFFWLLWGDICYTLMESVTGPIMQLKFKALGAMNWQMGLLTASVPMLVYSLFAPVISFKSDRYRSKLGRRIPFLLFSVPVLAVGLVALAFGDRLGHAIYHGLKLQALSEAHTVMLTLGVLLAAFTFFNTFTTTVFWYLFNDVVPEKLLARFMSWFRTISTISAAGYQFFIFPRSESHSTEIFIGAAVLYLVGFGLMCLNVREGQYPAPPKYVGEQTGPIAAIRTYAAECHSHKIYWYLWLTTFVGCIGAGVGTYDLYFRQSIGLTIGQIGIINGTSLIIISVLILASGWMGDRYGPIRVVLGAQVLQWLTLTPATLTWLFWRPDPASTWAFDFPSLNWLLGSYSTFEIHRVFLVSLLIYVGLAAPVAALTSMWDPPMLMRTFPRSRYGQFCSTNGLWRTAAWMIGGSLAGGFIDVMGSYVGKERAYAYGPLWSIAFGIPAFVLFVMFYREWKRHGADNYVAPVPGEDDTGAFDRGFEVMPSADGSGAVQAEMIPTPQLGAVAPAAER